MKRIVLIDEQPLVRQALRTVLEADGHQLLGEFDDGQDALQACVRLAPELLILDLVLPRMDGLELLRRLRLRGSRLHALVFTAQDSEHFAGLALQAGATGFVSKLDPVDNLREALSTVLRGHSYFPAQAIGTVALQQVSLLDEDEQLRSLSSRERTVLRYLASGRSNKDIADELALSDRTVSTYKIRLQRKLNVNSLAELLEVAWRHGLLGNAPVVADSSAPDGTGERFRQLFEVLPVSVGLRDREGYLLHCNPEYLRLAEATTEETVGLRVIDQPILAPEEALHYHQQYLQAVAAEQSFSREMVLHHHNRRVRVRHWGVPFRDEQGVMVGMLCGALDITDQEQQYLAATHARERLEAQRGERTLFLLDTAARMQRSLGEIGEALDAGLREMPQQLALQGARLTARALQDELGVLLDLAELDRGRLILRPRAVDLVQLTGKELAQFGSAATLAVGAASGAASVWLDPWRYRQMLGTLLPYCAAGGHAMLQVETRIEELTDAQLSWQLEIVPADASLEGLVDDPLPLEPRLLLCTRLAALMGGELRLFHSRSGQPAVRLRLQLRQAMPQA
ncbi:response regulator [Pseudomonas sp. UL073]|uniref:Response regulator n=1 Tax=Zestomonas insulae TaxID=2809017 RepID=A0ABS2IDW5_9GAMM|nr:response regulator [Pseudomonas insulae]MBM7061284.1 response regulator [Pseudomonas insulae]